MNLEEIKDEASRSRDGVPFNIGSELEKMIEEISSKPELKSIIDAVQDLELKQTEERDNYSSTDPIRNHEGIKSEPMLEEIVKLFVAEEEVGHSCNLCQSDLAIDPERPNALLRTLQEACVLACGHVYHFKCLQGTTLDLDNGSKDPSCILCIS